MAAVLAPVLITGAAALILLALVFVVAPRRRPQIDAAESRWVNGR